MNDKNKNILEIKNLKQYFVSGKKTIKAVDNVSFQIQQGETFSLVGESGSGKSTLARAVIRLYQPTDGVIEFKGQDISGKLNKEKKNLLCTKMQMIFQDPMASLNPRKKVIDIVAQGLDVNKLVTDKEERKQKVTEFLLKVGLNQEHMGRYPHQFSGGQRQRLGIARAMIMEPDFVIADEAISALDVSIQAQVINLLIDIQKETKITYLFIAHDLSMVKYISDRVGVMHHGHIVELGNVEDIYDNPVHPYTKSLLSAVPHPHPRLERSRKRVRFEINPERYQEGVMRQLNDTHFVLASQSDYESWVNQDF
jgi:oligopeptide transport system ATP-binding protein